MEPKSFVSDNIKDKDMFVKKTSTAGNQIIKYIFTHYIISLEILIPVVDFPSLHGQTLFLFSFALLKSLSFPVLPLRLTKAEPCQIEKT